MNDRPDAWTSATAYEKYMGRWSRQLAPQFVSWLPVAAGAHWLDVGCGTGVLTAAICAQAKPASVVACDPSVSFVDFAREALAKTPTEFVVTGVGNLPTRPGGFDSVTSLLALNFFPHPRAAVREMHRITAQGGLVSACVWDYVERMDMLRRFWDAAKALNPEAAAVEEGLRFTICEPEALKQLFASADLADVVCEPMEITTQFSDFADFWTPFLSGTGPGPTYVASLDTEAREALAAHLDRSLPREPNGAISLRARAWAVRGIAG